MSCRSKALDTATLQKLNAQGFVARTATGSGYGGLTRKYDLISTTDITTPSSWAGVSGFTGIVGAGLTVNAVLPIAPPNKSYRLKVWLE